MGTALIGQNVADAETPVTQTKSSVHNQLEGWKWTLDFFITHFLNCVTHYDTFADTPCKCVSRIIIKNCLKIFSHRVSCLKLLSECGIIVLKVLIVR